MQKLPDKLLLEIVQSRAQNQDYNPLNFRLSENGKHKLEYNHNNKWVKFGDKNYFDYPTYIYNYILGNISYEKAMEKRINYRKRAKSVMIKTNNKYSPSTLSYRFLW